MREEDGQGALFGGEAFLPAGRSPFPRPERPTAPPREGERERDREVVPPRDRERDVVPPGDVVPESAAAGDEIRVSRALAGPTLDDAVSRAWEALVAGVPAACPVCRGEVEPAPGGAHCGTCDMTLD
jgi:hypothetical protein